MPRHIQMSGAQKRRAAKEKHSRNEEISKSCPQLDRFLLPKGQTSASQSQAAELPAHDAQEVVSLSSSEIDFALAPLSNDVDKLSILSPAVNLPIPDMPLTLGMNDCNLSVQTEMVQSNCVDTDAASPCTENDIALWFPITSATVSFWINKEPNSCDNISASGDYPQSKRHYGPTKQKPKGFTRSLTNRLFHSKEQNGESRLRKWLVYSPSVGSVYCFYCTMMSSNSDQLSQAKGFSSWHMAENCIATHESSPHHRQCILDACKRRRETGVVDKNLKDEIDKKKKYWIEILRRVVAVVKFLATRGLPFRGDDEILGSKHNGNFLGCIELIAQFDPILQQHLHQYGNPGRGNISYLSSTIVEEFIAIMAAEVRKVIVKEIVNSKYFSVSVDSTPDLTHVDQLTVIVRYVNGRFEAVERFLTFLQIDRSHTGQNLADCLLDYLASESIDIMNCRGQSYDNASNMSGRYSGMQARLKAINPLAVFIPCTAHSLNLVGVHAVQCCVEAVNFFGLVQQLYNFWSASTHRWLVLTESLGTNAFAVTLKSLSDTRWCARADAVKALYLGYANILSALENIIEDSEQNSQTRHEAQCLLSAMGTIETAIMIDTWHSILTRFNDTSKKLQSTDCELHVALDLLSSLAAFLADLRERFDEFEARGIEMSGQDTYRSTATRRRKISRRIDSSAQDGTTLTGRDKFKVETFLAIIDQLTTSLNERRAAYNEVHAKFQVLTDFKKLSPDDIRELAVRLAVSYPGDLDKSVLPDEMIQLVEYAKINDCKLPSDIAQLLYTEQLQDTFPNAYVALRIYMCIMVSNCTGERSFSKMALIKNKLRSVMTDARLTALELLSVENDILDSITFDQVIDKFATTKCRKCL